VNEKNTTPGRSFADITIRVCHHDDPDSDGIIYQQRQMVPPLWFTDTRYHGYVAFQFQEMFEKMVHALKKAQS
jgi:hypothetical protein